MSSFTQYTLFILSFVSVITFARLLTPAEIGVFALCSSLILILSQLRSFGAAAYIVKQKTLTKEHIRSCLGITIIMSWTFGILLISLSHFIEAFFNAEGLQVVIVIVSTNFFLAPFIAINTSVLAKEMAFDKLAVIGFVQQVVMFFTSLFLVLKGYSFYGLAFGFLAGSVAQFFVMLKYRSEKMLFVPSVKGFGPILKLGLNTSGASFLKTFEINLPDLFIGRTLNPTSVAIFSRALGFQQFFTNLLVVGVNPVILPLLSRINNSGKDPSSAYIRATTLLLGIAIPILLVASAAAHPAVLLMFGDQWVSSIPLVSILALWALFNIVNQFTPNLLIVRELDNWLLYLQLISTATYAVLLYFAFPYGLPGVAYAMTAGAFLNLIVTFIFLQLKMGIQFSTIFKENIPSIVVGIICYSTTLMIDKLIDFEITSSLISIAIIAGVLPFVWVLSIVITKHPILDVIIKPLFITLRDKMS